MEKKTYKPSICGTAVELPLIRSKAIKAYCTDCSAGQRIEIVQCASKDCPLYPFRGYVAWNKEKMSNEDRLKARERLKGKIPRNTPSE